MRTVLLVSALVATALALPAAAGTDPCTAGRVVDIGGLAYVVVDESIGGKNLVSVWVYIESNGEPGLQQGAHCDGSTNPDTALF